MPVRVGRHDARMRCEARGSIDIHRTPYLYPTPPVSHRYSHNSRADAVPHNPTPLGRNHAVSAPASLPPLLILDALRPPWRPLDL